ncbi:MAG: hypothetical protein ACW98G_10300 [Candidatus Hodarchaeales archaeon]|jgi:geranylgeranyl pyrophosphate synthase
MEINKRSLKAKLLSAELLRERLQSLNYSESVYRALDLSNVYDSPPKTVSSNIVLMDISWQQSENIPSVTELASAYFPISCFFLGTTFQDDLLDSLAMIKTRTLVETLGIPTCMIMGNILYCEGLIALFGNTTGSINTKNFLDSTQRLVHGIMDSEIYRRNHIGRILTLEGFLNLWRYLTPNRVCIEIGGLCGKSKKALIQILLDIGSNISITRRIIKEISEMYGLRGSMEENLCRKPPPLPVSLGYDLASPSEKKKIEGAIQYLAKKEPQNISSVNKEFEIIIDVVARYDAISAALNIHKNLINDTIGLITQIPNSEHREVLIHLLGTEIHD